MSPYTVVTTAAVVASSNNTWRSAPSYADDIYYHPHSRTTIVDREREREYRNDIANREWEQMSTTFTNVSSSFPLHTFAFHLPFILGVWNW